jgi:hypothetical protein
MLEDAPDNRQYNTTTKIENIKKIHAIGQIKKIYI